jgi:hypothetical protein
VELGAAVVAVMMLVVGVVVLAVVVVVVWMRLTGVAVRSKLQYVLV